MKTRQGRKKNVASKGQILEPFVTTHSGGNGTRSVETIPDVHLNGMFPHLLGSGRGLFVIVEANIGAGKSEFCNMLQNFRNDPQHGRKCVLLKEPVDKPTFRTLLGRFYQDPARWGAIFQLYALKERFTQHMQAVEACGRGLDVVQDRSIYADSCFGDLVRRDGNMTDEEWEVYCDTFSNLQRFLRYPDVLVYLRVAPEICHERMRRRSRSEESGVPLDYLQRLHEEHEMYVQAMARYVQVLVIDWEHFGDIVPDVSRQIDQLAQERHRFMRDFRRI